MNKVAPWRFLKDKTRRNSFVQIAALLLLAYIVSFVPILHWPFKWMETFFHEISHGLAAILTGGKILSIQINWNGSGSCVTQGGIRFFVVFFGYAGASLWGAFIFLLASKIRRDYAFVSGLIVVVFILICCVLWTANITTFFILCFLLLPFCLVYFAKKIWLEKIFMQFSGLYVLLNSLKSPTYLFDGSDLGDGATLEKLTGLPEIFWIIIWCLWAILCFWAIVRLAKF